MWVLVGMKWVVGWGWVGQASRVGSGFQKRTQHRSIELHIESHQAAIRILLGADGVFLLCCERLHAALVYWQCL